MPFHLQHSKSLVPLPAPYRLLQGIASAMIALAVLPAQARQEYAPIETSFRFPAQSYGDLSWQSAEFVARQGAGPRDTIDLGTYLGDPLYRTRGLRSDQGTFHDSYSFAVGGSLPLSFEAQATALSMGDSDDRGDSLSGVTYSLWTADGQELSPSLAGKGLVAYTDVDPGRYVLRVSGVLHDDDGRYELELLPSVSAVPEPSAWRLMLGGILALGSVRLIRRR